MNGDHEWELEMPFVVCTSQGGPFDDEAFVAGWRLAQIDAALAPSGAAWAGFVRTPDLPQLDLIAMRHGATVTVDAAPDPDTGWRNVFVGVLR